MCSFTIVVGIVVDLQILSVDSVNTLSEPKWQWECPSPDKMVSKTSKETVVI